MVLKNMDREVRCDWFPVSIENILVRETVMPVSGQVVKKYKIMRVIIYSGQRSKICVKKKLQEDQAKFISKEIPGPFSLYLII